MIRIPTNNRDPETRFLCGQAHTTYQCERESIPTSIRICSVHYTHCHHFKGVIAVFTVQLAMRDLYSLHRVLADGGMSSMQRGKDLHREILMGYQVGY